MSVNINELLPCPFCGGKAKWKGYYTGSTSGLVECAECAACTRGVNWEDAKERWNARAERTCTMEKKKSGYFTGLICSKCGCTSFYMYDDPGEHGMFIGLPFPEYCYNCGARVVSEEEQGHMVADAIRRLEKAVEE